MPSNYKRLGDFIKEVNVRNTDLKINKLIGVSIEKKFISSVANIIGTDMSVYKVIKKNQLACKLMSVGRDEKLPVDLYLSDEPAIISSAYYVFEPKSHEVLLPEYLKMWLFRTETDRYVGYISGGDVRGGISWDTFCDMPVIIPSIEKQREIVKEYHVIQNRILLNNHLITKLEETAQAIYKQWFVDQGNCEKIKISELVKTQYGYTETASSEIIGPKFLRITDIAQKNIDWKNVPYCKISDSEFEKYRLKPGDIVVARTGATAGYGKRLHKNFPDCVFASFLVRLIPNELKWNLFLGLTVDSPEYRDYVLSNAEGSAQPQANATLLASFEINKPDETKILEFNRLIEPFFDSIENHHIENQKLTELKELLLARMTRVESEKV